jgi:23S rRNA pseudouridine2605 synthase
VRSTLAAPTPPSPPRAESRLTGDSAHEYAPVPCYQQDRGAFCFAAGRLAWGASAWYARRPLIQRACRRGLKVAEERLQKLLARAGVASRRAAEELIVAGRVSVNGKVVNELGAKADLATDRILVDGRPIAREAHAYYVVHKPKGMVTTLKDPEGRPSLGEILDKLPERVYPVGRLDFHTSGVLLVTNDGDLAQALLHPSREVPKTYVAKLTDLAPDKALDLLRRGVTLDDGYRTAPALVTRLRDDEGHTWLEITITEGKNRQIHRMIEFTGLHVMRLSRTRFAGLSSEGLRPSQVRPLEPMELALLRRTYQGILEAPPAAPARPKPPGGARAVRDNARANAKRPSPGTKGETPRSTAKRPSVRTNAEKPRAEFDKPRGARHKSRPI